MAAGAVRSSRERVAELVTVGPSNGRMVGPLQAKRVGQSSFPKRQSSPSALARAFGPADTARPHLSLTTGVAAGFASGQSAPGSASGQGGSTARALRLRADCDYSTVSCNEGDRWP